MGQKVKCPSCEAEIRPLMTVKVDDDEMNVFSFPEYNEHWRPRSYIWCGPIEEKTWNKHTSEEKVKIYSRHLETHIKRSSKCVRIFMKNHNGRY